MKYVALLRGINVGGNAKVEMDRLKKEFEKLGFTHVISYINSGNIIFDSNDSIESMKPTIEQAIEKEFKITVIVTLRDLKAIKKIDASIPASWVNNQDIKTDVLFLWPEIDSKKILEQLTIKPEIDEVVYVKGAVIWRVDKKNVTKSGLLKIIGTDLYKKMTVRNVNTLRKLALLMQDI